MSSASEDLEQAEEQYFFQNNKDPVNPPREKSSPGKSPVNSPGKSPLRKRSSLVKTLVNSLPDGNSGQNKDIFNDYARVGAVEEQRKTPMVVAGN